jgi:putative nucleotidyltransferase with HDIG domain
MIGSTLLNYKVLSELGSGGLGTVYAAEHVVIGRKAALKVLKPEIARDQAMVQRFLVEARAVGAIRHPNIVDVSDYGQADGHFIIVMELLEGETLAQRLEREGQLAEATALRLLTQLASALGAAHERSIVHRDLKPENIFLTSYPDYPDFVKVLDFGVAKLLGGTSKSVKTSPGLIIGTPAYMSPEQCLGDDALDLRSDVYSLGVVAYRLVTGQVPFEGNLMQQLQGHLTRPPRPPRELAPELSPALEQVVLRCLAKAPADRFPTMQALRDALTGMGGRSPLAFSPEEAAGPRRSQPASAPAGAKPAPPPASAPPPDSRRAATRASGDTRVGAPRSDEQERQQAVAVATRMRDIISKRLQSDSLQLPTVPEVAVRCLELAHNPDVTFAALSQVIERDPFIASRVVRMSNSPLYGGLARITTIDGAVSRLGISTLVSLLQELAAEQVFTSKDPTIRNAFRGIWEHCLGVAHLSRDLAALVGHLSPNTAYLAGLFHDIGKPIVAALLLEVERNLPGGKVFLDSGVWRRVVDECHRDVGATIAFRWYLPREVATAVAELDWYDLKLGRHSAANVVRLANALCQREGLDVKAADPRDLARVVVQGMQVLRLSEEQVELAITGLVARVQSVTNQKEEGTRVFDRMGAAS